LSVRDAFFGFYRKVQSIVAPKLKYSQLEYEAVLQERVAGGDSWMDLGCGHALLPPWRLEQEQALAARASIIVGFDPDLEAIRKHRTITNRVRGDASRLPFHSTTFDFISSNMVFEHLQEPEVQLAEIHRVLRPGGTLVFHTPNKFGYGVLLGRLLPDWVKVRMAWVLQGRKAEDVYPAYYRINSERRIRELAARCGFDVREVRLVVSTPSLIMIPPLVVIELLFLRLLMSRWLRPMRTNIIGVLQKQSAG
jgi:SAM-dependent methyltransferase